MNNQQNDESMNIEEELQNALEQSEENLKGWQRAVADFENYKRRDQEHHKELVEFAEGSVLMQFLGILEDLDRVLANTPDNPPSSPLEQGGNWEVAEWKKGLEGVHKRFHRTLQELGLEKVPTVGEKFNHRAHEAVMQVEGGEEGMVAEEIAPGYKRGDKILLPAKVKVFKKNS